MAKRIIINEQQAKKLVKFIAEELQTGVVNAGTFRTPQEAESFLAYIRQKYGFSKYDSYTVGTKVIILVTKDKIDDNYFYDMIDMVRADARTGRYEQVCESLNESFSSRRLAKLAKEHGGISVSRNGGLRSFVKAWQYGNGVDVSTVTDDMLVGEPFVYDTATITPSQENNAILFNDGYAIEIDKNADIKRPVSGKRKLERYGSGIGDTGDHDKRESPFFKDGKRDTGAQYNGFGTSVKSGESQHLRQAMKNVRKDLDYYNNHPDEYNSKENIRQSKQSIDRIHGYAKDLLKK